MKQSASEILKRIRRIEISTRKLVNESLAGEYHSMFRGRGMEFSEVREYQDGDDIRTIDWNVTARMGTPYVKQYVEERELTVQILIDLSGSGLFGSSGMKKREMEAEIAALLAFSAISNQDKVGLIIFTDRVEHYLPPRKGREHVLRIIRDILYFEPQSRGTDVEEALRYAGRLSSKRSVMFLISDFLAPDFERTLSILNRRHDIVAISVRDRHESELPSLGLVDVEDLETGRIETVDFSSRRVRDRYEAMMEAQSRRIRDNMRRAGVDILTLRADQEYEKKLIAFFASRARGIRHREVS